MKEMTVGDVMTHLVVTFRPQDAIEGAALRLLRNHISGGPVVREGKLVGVISEADIIAAYARVLKKGPSNVKGDPLAFLLLGEAPGSGKDVKVEDAMITSVISATPTTSLSEAASMMDRHGVRRLPVVDEENFVVGIVARADLIRALASTGRVA